MLADPAGGAGVAALGSLASNELLPATGAIAPRLGPPTNLTLNGASAHGPAPGVGVQPVFTWSPPTVGQATAYGV